MLAAWKNAATRQFNDRASRLIASIGLSVTLGLVLLGIYLVRDLRQTAWEQAERNAANLLVLVQQAVARNVELYDTTLQAAARGAINPEIAALDPRMRRLALFDGNTNAPGLGAMIVVDAAGGAVIASRPDLPVGAPFGDLDEFAAHRLDPHLGLQIRGPRISRVTGRTIVALSRRVSAPDGAFAGMVIGGIYLDYFQALFQRLNIGDGSAVNLFLEDGTLLARGPYDPRFVGRSVAAGEPYKNFRKSRSGMIVASSVVDDVKRLYAFAHLDGLPLIVDVAVGVDSIDATWRPKAALIGGLVAALILATFSLTLLLQREILRRAAAEASSRSANAELAELARTDFLTGLANRRHYDEVFAREWRRATRTGSPLSLLVVDTDHFKRFNDHFGHRRGDEVLRAIGAQLRELAEPLDALAARIGGEEFAVLLPGLDAAEARAAAERLRRAVIRLDVPHAPEVGGVATVSVGVAHAIPGAGLEPEALFQAADAALYEAKRCGRNRVRVGMPGGAPPAAEGPAALSA